MIFHSYVKLPEGTTYKNAGDWGMVNMALFYPHYRNNTANIVIIKGIMKKKKKLNCLIPTVTFQDIYLEIDSDILPRTFYLTFHWRRHVHVHPHVQKSPGDPVQNTTFKHDLSDTSC